MVITRWTGREVTALRAAMRPRHTQVQFAERIGCTIEAVGKWEQRGAAITLRPKYADCMDTQLARLSPDERAIFQAALNASLPDRPMIADTGQSATQHPVIEDDDVNRRESLGAIAGLSVLAAGDAMPGKALTRIGVSDAARVQAETDRLEREDQHVGGGFLLRQAQRSLEQAKMLLEIGEFTSESGPAFMSATGNMAVLVGWSAYECENHSLARRCFADALSLANLADDDELTVHACLYAALQSNRLARQGIGSPYYTLRLTERARDLTHGLPSGRIHALIAVREASAFAILGDRAAFSRQIASAWREMDCGAQFEPLEECPVWLRFMSHGEVRFQEARGIDDLGQTGNAISVYADAIQREAGIRNAVNYQAQLAAALAGIGDTSNAVAEGMAVLDRLEGAISSARTLRDLAAVRSAVHDDRHSTAADFRHRHDQLACQAGGPTV
jgi:hypothetical protein